MAETKKPKGLALLMASEPPGEEMGDMGDASGVNPRQSTAELSASPHPEPDEDDKGMPTITVPKGFQPPEDKQMGQEFTGTYRGYMTEDGRLCLTAVNDMPLDGSQPDSDESEDSGDGEAASSSEQAAVAPANAQDEGGAIESTPHVKESKKLKALLNGR